MNVDNPMERVFGIKTEPPRAISATKLKLVWPGYHKDLDIISPPALVDGLLIVHLDKAPSQVYHHASGCNPTSCVPLPCKHYDQRPDQPPCSTCKDYENFEHPVQYETVEVGGWMCRTCHKIYLDMNTRCCEPNCGHIKGVFTYEQEVKPKVKRRELVEVTSRNQECVEVYLDRPWTDSSKIFHEWEE